jgi:hypothetical protein
MRHLDGPPARVFQHVRCFEAAIAATQIALERRQHLRFHALAGDYSLLIVLHHGSRFLPDRFRPLTWIKFSYYFARVE